jgi:AsmA protein
VWPLPSLTLHNVILDRSGSSASDGRIAIGEIRAGLEFASLLSGAPKISELAIDHPTLRLPMLRERTGTGRTSGPAAGEAAPDHDLAFPASRMTVSTRTIVFFDPQTGFEETVGDVNASVTLDAERKINVTGDARPGDRSLTFALAAVPPAGPLGRRNIPAELTLEISGQAAHRLTAKAEVRINGGVLLINGLSGSLDDGKFNGWASVDLAGKPLVKIDLDFSDSASARRRPSPALREPARSHGATYRSMSAGSTMSMRR